MDEIEENILSEVSSNEEDVFEEADVTTEQNPNLYKKLDMTEPANSLKRYFEYRRGDQNAKCRVCSEKLSRKDGNTKSMSRHLKQHKTLVKEYDDAKKNVSKQQIKRPQAEPGTSSKQLKLTDYKPADKWTNENRKSQQIDECILNYICRSCDALSLTERPGFSEIFDAAAPSYRVKSREYMTKLMEEKYATQFQKVKAEIMCASFLSFTTDVWTNKNKKKSFISLTCHFMDEEYHLHWKILATEPLLEKHDGANIGNKLNEIINLYEIDKTKIHLFLRDAASSMKRAMENIQLSHFDCMVHKIQLAISDALEHRNTAVADAKLQIGICRNLVAYYNRSSTFQNFLAKQQELTGTPRNALLQDIVTRWNSTFYMIERILQQQPPLVLAQIEFKDLILPDFNLLAQIIKVLSPFEKFTRKLSKREERISAVLPVYKCLLNVLTEEGGDTEIVIQLKSILRNGVKSRMVQFERKSFLVIATLIDPRYKNHSNIFNTAAERGQNIALLQTEIELSLSPERRNSETNSPIRVNVQGNDDPMATFLSHEQEIEDIDRPHSQCLAISDEIEAFFKAKNEPSESNPLQYWHNEHKFPSIKQLVPKYLSAPPSTVESERTFSQLTEIYSSKRASLSHEHGKQQLFLHFNY